MGDGKRRGKNLAFSGKIIHIEILSVWHERRAKLLPAFSQPERVAIHTFDGAIPYPTPLSSVNRKNRSHHPNEGVASTDVP